MVLTNQLIYFLSVKTMRKIVYNYYVCFSKSQNFNWGGIKPSRSLNDGVRPNPKKDTSPDLYIDFSTNKNLKNISLLLPNEDWVQPQLQMCYSKILLKWIVVYRLENWRKSETKNAQVSRKQKNNNKKNLKTYHYHYPMRTGLSLSYRYVILKYVWNELSSTDRKIDVRVKL